jgi:hypothetical protein
MSDRFKRLAAAMRAGLAGEDNPFVPADDRPDLDYLMALVAKGCRGVVDLDTAEWRIVVDELTYQIARILARDGKIQIPNLGLLSITYGEQGQQGLLILAPEATP